MERKDMVKIGIVVIVALSFITEIWFFGGSVPGLGGGGGGSASNVSGMTTFQGTIRTYDPVLVIPANTSQAVIDQLRARDDVRNVKLEEDTYVIEPETRYDVYPIAVFLRSLNTSSLSAAIVSLPQEIVVDTPLGKVNATSTGIVRVVTEPLLDVDSEVTVSMVATVADGMLINYASPQIMLQPLHLSLNASVVRLDNKVYSYVVPWESRNSLGNLSAYGAVEYGRVDSVIFKTPLNVSQIMAKKMFPYVVFIDAGSATVEPGFVNVTQLAINFQDTPYELPPSALRIVTNETPDIPFNATVRYSYTLGAGNETYDFGALPLVLESDRELEVNGTVNVDVDAVAIGNRILAIKGVSLPS